MHAESNALSPDTAAGRIPGAIPHSPCDTGWLPRSLLAISAAALGVAVHTREGLNHSTGIRWLTLSILACLAALLIRPTRARQWVQKWVPILVMGLALVLQFTQLYRAYPGTIWNSPKDDPKARSELSVLKDQEPWIENPVERKEAQRRIVQIESSLKDPRFHVGILIAAGLAATLLLSQRWARYAGMPLLLTLHFALGVWMIRTSPDPYIDVYVFQQESSAALLAGQNPYAITFTNIYGPDAYVYGAGLTQEGRVNFGFPYTPLSLLLALPGYAIAGDHRYAQLFALTLAGAMLAYARPGRIGMLAALLLLFTPRIFMIVELSWTEPFVVMLLAATIFCACRFPRATPYVFGLFLASKQYLLFAVPLAVLLLPGPFNWRDYLRLMAKALLVAAIVSLPMMIWNPTSTAGLRAFLHSAVMLQFQQPFRTDSLGYLAHLWWTWNKDWPPRLSWLAFAAVVPAIVASLRKWPHSAGGFAASIGLVYLAFFAFNKQAFCNYYFFVIGALCCAVAAFPHRSETATPQT